ncbi:MAG TPA: hypothetical protein PKI20_21215 [Verrucomicrobiota bacterium]|jgi:uncharacterized protein RhaS with RHS repeats|nr:hypothetical protein [Verrucomicrobiota bacterium]
MNRNNNIILAALLPLLLLAADSASAHYDPGTQRWLTRDPLADTGSLVYQTIGTAPWNKDADVDESTEDQLQGVWIQVNRNLYTTLANNPVSTIDPLGLADCPAGLGPGSLNPENLTALDTRTAGEIARAAAQRAREKMAKAVQAMIKQGAKDGAKSLQRSIRSFDKLIRQHLQKIADNPTSRDVGHWKSEIENWQRLKEAAEKVLKACPQQPGN